MRYNFLIRLHPIRHKKNISRQVDSERTHLKMAPLEVNGREAQLVLDRLGQLLVARHQSRFVAELVRALEQHSILQVCRWT